MADFTFIPRPTVTNTLDQLEKRALIRRQAHPGDRRRVIIMLEPEGERVASEALELFQEYHSRVESQFDASELEQYLKMRLKLAQVRDEVVQQMVEERNAGK